jgi:hypothetical protein
MNSFCCFWKTNLPIVSAIERAENSFTEDRLNKKMFYSEKWWSTSNKIISLGFWITKHLFSECVRRILC